jgi:hypothetical protein
MASNKSYASIINRWRQGLGGIVDQQSKAMSGDLVFVVTPATKAPAPTSAAWTLAVEISLQSADGQIHSWFSKTVSTGCSIADTSTAGTASIPDTNLVFQNGVASKVISGDAQAWLNAETATLTIAQLSLLGFTVAQKTCVITFTTP